jgi:hypothetical protein
MEKFVMASAPITMLDEHSERQWLEAREQIPTVLAAASLSAGNCPSTYDARLD